MTYIMKINETIIEDQSLFPELTAEEIEFIASKGTYRKFPRNTVVISEGDVSDYMYIIRKGQVMVYVTNQVGKDAVLNIQNEGEYFGELAMIDHQPRSASVKTVGAVELVFVSRADFEASLLEKPELAVKFLSAVTQRVRYLTDVVKNISLNDVWGRVVNTLNMLAEEDKEQRVINVRLTHQDIANMVGSSREMVSRILRDLQIEGYIDNDHKNLVLLKELPVKR